MMNPVERFLTTLLIFLVFPSCLSIDILAPNQSIKDGDVLVSSGQSYALGFFSPGMNYTRRYVGIWYHKVSETTVVWVANRDNPINSTSGVLAINKQGNLVIYENNRSTIPVWSTNVSASPMTNSTAQLQDTGNLILVQQHSKTVLWQSFDHPVDTLLPDMKLGLNLKIGLTRSLSSRMSKDNPGTGTIFHGIDPNGFPQLFLWKGETRLWRSGPWTGQRFSGIPTIPLKEISNVTFVSNLDEVFVFFRMINPSIISRTVVNESGVLQQLTWNDRGQQWIEISSVPKEPCDIYGHCGTNGNCDPYQENKFICNCLPGFEPKSPKEWYINDGSGGCVRKPNVSICHSGEGFVKLARVKVPDTSMAHANMSLSLEECAQECLINCSCTAYASADERGIGCLRWYGDLVDTRMYSGLGQEIYIRVDAAEVAQYMKNSKGFLAKKGALAALVTPLALASIGFISTGYYLMKKKTNGRRAKPDLYIEQQKKDLEETTSSNLPIFDIKTITASTNNFSFANKLGQGGFGLVYKGRLPNGQEIAVKRLSKNSRQGIEEFKNEVRLISKLQHKNLVRLFGCCINEEEKMLVYEYLPNKSLDFFIFHKTRRELLDWSQRFEIIRGIAQGLLYLHQDSRLKIIHRDLKAGNVLLDSTMIPKISDFGMARIFGEDQIETNTNRVVGTYGYMSPEYAMEGLYSVKSDVFSYGVMVLEVISGRKNNDYYDESPSQNLISQAWNLWNEGKPLEIVVSALRGTGPTHEVLKFIQVGLLCVQESPANRPKMSTIVFMLDNETILPSPNKPAFISRRKQSDSSSSTIRERVTSINDVTLTNIEAR